MIDPLQDVKRDPRAVLEKWYDTRLEQVSDRTIYWCRECRAYSYTGTQRIPHVGECRVGILAASIQEADDLRALEGPARRIQTLTQGWLPRTAASVFSEEMAQALTDLVAALPLEG